jgi:hypothetical protein
MSEPQVIGLYITAFVESAGEVSIVFERKAKEMLADHGIEDIDVESWYDLNAFERAVTEIEEQVGGKTTRQAAVKMIEVDDKIPDQNSARDGFEILKTQQRNAMDDFSVEDCGQYRIEQLDPQEFRVATYGGWGYPEAFTGGLMKGVIQETERQGAKVELDSVSTSGDEVYAYKVSW